MNKCINKRLLTIIVLYVLYAISFFFLEWTDDWYNYEYMLSHIDEYDTDYVYKLISMYSFKYGYSYRDVFQAHILFQAFFFSLFIYKTCKKPWFPAIMLILLNYVSIANQIRYFMGLWIFLYAMTLYDKKKIVYYLLGVLACLNHTGLAILFLCMPSMRLFTRIDLKKYCVLFPILIFSTAIITMLLPDFLEVYGKYLDAERQSSFFGGVFMFFPFFYFIKLYFGNRYKLSDENEDSNQQKVLSCISMFSLLMLPLSIHVHLFADRFVLPMISVWIAYIYTAANNESYKQVKIMTIICVLWFYFAEKIVLGYSYYYDNLQVMFGLKEYLNV